LFPTTSGGYAAPDPTTEPCSPQWPLCTCQGYVAPGAPPVSDSVTTVVPAVVPGATVAVPVVVPPLCGANVAVHFMLIPEVLGGVGAGVEGAGAVSPGLLKTWT